jgi:hypothetical protein
VPSYFWIPFAVLGALLLVLLLFTLVGRIQNGRYVRPILKLLAKIPFMRRLFHRMTVAQLERSNPELASAVKKMRRFGEPTNPDQVQRALRVLTPAERKAYLEAAGQESAGIDATNRQQRRRLEHGGPGMPVRPAAGPQRPGAAGRKRKKR